MDLFAVLSPVGRAFVRSALKVRSFMVFCILTVLLGQVQAAALPVLSISAPVITFPPGQTLYAHLSVTVNTVGLPDIVRDRLTYYWSCDKTTLIMGSNNGLHSANTLRVDFTKADTYYFSVKVSDPGVIDPKTKESISPPDYETITGTTGPVPVNAVPTGVKITPSFNCAFGTDVVPYNITPPYTRAIVDQFGAEITPAGWSPGNWMASTIDLDTSSNPVDSSPMNPSTGVFTVRSGWHSWTITTTYINGNSTLTGTATLLTNKLQVQFRPPITYESEVDYLKEPGYLPDYGAALITTPAPTTVTWGWNKTLTEVARSRSSELNQPSFPGYFASTKLYKSFIEMQGLLYLTSPNLTNNEVVGKLVRDTNGRAVIQQDLTASWSVVNLPSNTYTVRVLCSDPAYSGSHFDIRVNGYPVVFEGGGVTTPTSRWDTGSVNVPITGTITISNGPAAVKNLINAIIIVPASNN